MPDQASKRAAEEIFNRFMHCDTAEDVDEDEIEEALNPDCACPICPHKEECSQQRREIAAIIERHMESLSLVDLAHMVQKREKYLQKEIEAGRWLDCQGELADGKGDRLVELETELDEGCKLIETVMHQYDEE